MINLAERGTTVKQTKKLYEENPYLKNVEARVLTEQVRGYDGLYEVVLDQTLFYPTGGGQPYDRGFINEVAVLDVYKTEGVIYHVLESSLNNAEDVVLRLDWERRFDHMQQHSGQHVLSRAFEIILEAETVGFHLGEELVTIDLTIDSLNESMLNSVEALANSIITENRRIAKNNIKEDKIPEEVKKKIPELDKYVRIVEIDDFDYCACSGTHPDTTAEIGLIKILGWEKYKQKVRLSFVCGNRAIATMDKFQKQLYDTAAILKTNWEDVKNNVSRILAEKEEAEKRLRDLSSKLLGYEVDELLKEAEYNGHFYYLEKTFENRDFNEIKHLAEGVIKEGAFVALFTNKTAEKVQFLLQRSEGIDIPLNECLKHGLEVIEGKGGGNPKVAQGGGAKVENMQLALERMRKCIVEKN